jgi:hypothetical protein
MALQPLRCLPGVLASKQETTFARMAILISTQLETAYRRPRW